MIPELHVTGVFRKNFYESTKKIVVNRGGTRSSKTYSVCQQLMVWLFTGYIRANQKIETGVASVVRKYSTTLSKTVMRDFEEILKENDLYRLVDHHKTDRTYSFNGRMVEFFGADDQQKIRGYKSNILFCNEANELGFKTEFFQLLVRTTDLLILDFNPSDPYIWINEEIEQKRAHEKGDVDVIISTYKDNGYLTRGQIEEIEYLQKTDAELWAVYGLGEYGKVHGLVFPNITIINEMPQGLKKYGYGLDFGFTNDVTATVACGILHGNCLYLDEIIYETALTNPLISANFEANGLRKKEDEIIADSAEPKSIQELNDLGWYVTGAYKGKDSVKHGIQALKKYKIHVTARSVNLQKEQKKYKWKVDRDGNVLNIPIDAYNHLWDAVRYWGSLKIRDLDWGFA